MEINGSNKLIMIFMAHGIRESGNNFAEFFTAKRWLINNKMLLHKMKHFEKQMREKTKFKHKLTRHLHNSMLKIVL